MSRKSIVISLLVCVVVISLAAVFASSQPDGLEWVAAKMGFEKSASTAMSAPMPDYQIAFFGKSVFSAVAAALLGTVAVFGGTILLARTFFRRKSGDERIK